MKGTVFLNKKGQKSGELVNGVFSKFVSKKRHFMRKNRSWAIDLDILNNLPDPCVIKICDTDENRIYQTDKNTFLEEGFVENFGHGVQVFLSLDFFK